MFKREKYSQIDKDLSFGEQFIEAMNWVNFFSREEVFSREERLQLLQYMLDVVKRDIQAEYLVYNIYNDDEVRYRHFFPYRYYDEVGKELKLQKSGEKKVVSLQNDCVVTFPREKERLANSIIHIAKEKFKFIPLNHEAVYYSPIGVCHVSNGFHSISSGIMKKEGIILADVLDITPLFEHVDTDGTKFFNIHTRKKLVDVEDFRVALLYKIAKIKHDVENQARFE